MSLKAGPRSPRVALAALVLISITLGFKGSKRPPGVKSPLGKSGPDPEVPCDNPEGCDGTMKLKKGRYHCDTCPRTIAASDYQSRAREH